MTKIVQKEKEGFKISSITFFLVIAYITYFFYESFLFFINVIGTENKKEIIFEFLSHIIPFTLAMIGIIVAHLNALQTER